MMPSFDPTTGLLPLGRYAATLDDVRAAYVDAPEFSRSTSRAAIWAEFESATNELRRIVPTVCVWLAGSFMTDKLDPDDIDTIYWCEDRHIANVSDPTDRMILQWFATNAVRANTGLRIDTRYGEWHVYPEAAFSVSAEHQSYVQRRGYWDDFWQRRRSGAKTDPPVRTDALPRTGYVEVILDGLDAII